MSDAPAMVLDPTDPAGLRMIPADPTPPVPTRIRPPVPGPGKRKAGPGRRKGTKGVPIRPSAWAEVEALYAAGELSQEQISVKLGITREAVSRHMTKKKIVGGSKAAELAAATKAAVNEAIVTDASILAARIKETKDNHYQMASGLAKLVWNEILVAKKNGTAVGAIYPNIKSLQTAINALKQCREERFAVLGLDRPDAMDNSDLPELVVSELTEAQVEQLRLGQAQEMSDDPEPAMALPESDLVSEGGA
jgi:predicted XRE-type DNA-binding protein